MATANNTIKTRIQLKNDTEANWNKIPSFIPLAGELIIYSADTAHPFSRLKIGDGTTGIANLPFIDAGTLNGEETNIVKKATFNDFPSPGSSNKLYIDLSTNRIYHYTPSSGYKELSDFNLTKTPVNSVTGWLPGQLTEATIENNVFKIVNGKLPTLLWKEVQAVTDVTKGG